MIRGYQKHLGKPIMQWWTECHVASYTTFCVFTLSWQKNTAKKNGKSSLVMQDLDLCRLGNETSFPSSTWNNDGYTSWHTHSKVMWFLTLMINGKKLQWIETKFAKFANFLLPSFFTVHSIGKSSHYQSGRVSNSLTTIGVGVSLTVLLAQWPNLLWPDNCIIINDVMFWPRVGVSSQQPFEFLQVWSTLSHLKVWGEASINLWKETTRLRRLSTYVQSVKLSYIGLPFCKLVLINTPSQKH